MREKIFVLFLSPFFVFRAFFAEVQSSHSSVWTSACVCVVCAWEINHAIQGRVCGASVSVFVSVCLSVCLFVCLSVCQAISQ